MIVPDSQMKWGFNINSITIEGHKYIIDQYAYINSGIDFSIRSTYIYTIFKQYFDNNSLCNCGERSDGKKECYIDKEAENQIISLNIGNILFDFSLRAFFKKTRDSSLIFTIKNNIKQNQKEDIIHLGKSFMELFNLINFDFQTKEISFYSNTIKIGHSKQVVSIHFLVYWLLFIEMIFGIILLNIILYYSKL